MKVQIHGANGADSECRFAFSQFAPSATGAGLGRGRRAARKADSNAARHYLRVPALRLVS